MGWEELKARGCKPSRWQGRRAEQLAAVALTEPVKAYLASWDVENSSFLSRCVSSESVCRTLTGAKYDWPENDWLTQCRAFCKESLTGPKPCGPDTYTHELASRFLDNLATGAERDTFMDPVSCVTTQLMLAAWNSPINLLELTALLEFLCFKNSKGDLPIGEQFANERLLDFSEDIIKKVLDPSILAQRTLEN